MTLPPVRRPTRTASDTAQWCRERAAADLVSAGLMDTPNARLRYEHSAASWSARAQLLQRLKDGAAERRSASAVMPPQEEAPSARRRPAPSEVQHVQL